LLGVGYVVTLLTMAIHQHYFEILTFSYDVLVGPDTTHASSSYFGASRADPGSSLWKWESQCQEDASGSRTCQPATTSFTIHHCKFSHIV